MKGFMPYDHLYESQMLALSIDFSATELINSFEKKYRK